MIHFDLSTILCRIVFVAIRDWFVCMWLGALSTEKWTVAQKKTFDDDAQVLFYLLTMLNHIVGVYCGVSEGGRDSGSLCIPCPEPPGKPRRGKECWEFKWNLVLNFISNWL